MLDISMKEKQCQFMTTFELVLNSKVKNNIIAFLPLIDFCQLMQSSKTLYLALAPPKVIVPHAVRLGLKQLRNEINICLQ
jgi:hypothetical protein